MTRWRRPGAGEILLAYLLLDTAADVVNWLWHSLDSRDPLQWWLHLLFLRRTPSAGLTD